MFTSPGSGWSCTHTPSLGAVLRDFRLIRGLSQADLALKVGWDPTRVSQIETGRNRPSRATLDKVMTALELSANERNDVLLVGGFLPAESEIQELLGEIQDRIMAWPFPAFVLDFTLRILYWNKAAEQTFVFLKPFFGKIRKERTRLLELIFDPVYKLEQHLGSEEWTRIARDELISFQFKYRYRLHDPWYQPLLRNLRRYPQFSELWQRALLGNPTEPKGEVRLGRDVHQTFVLFARPVRQDPRFEEVFYSPKDVRDSPAASATGKAGKSQTAAEGNSR